MGPGDREQTLAVLEKAYDDRSIGTFADSSRMPSVDTAHCARLTVNSIDPVTGKVIEQFDATPVDLLPEIVCRARNAQSLWGEVSVPARCDVLRRLRRSLYERRSELAHAVTRETGKPVVEALYGEILIALDALDHTVRHAVDVLREQRVPHHNLAVKAKRGYLRYEPYGVVVIISPWNYPLSIPLGQIFAALVGGNAVVLKPSELTPRCGVLIAECCNDAKLPADLVQVVQGDGAVGAALIEAHPDKVVFTGSATTGRRIAEACARLLIPSVLELGGKDAMIVLDDANLDAASSAAVWGGFTNCGQACVSVDRVYVERSVADEFLKLCVAKTQLLKIGPGSDAENEIGPMIRPQAVDRVETQLREAVAAGARILTDGRRRPDLGPSFFEPAIVTDVNHQMRLMREETFGPVLAVMAVDDAEQAVALANDSPFGLSASIWTGDPDRGRKLAARLHCGAVMVNDVGSYFGIAEAPHGGRGASGWGRTHSRVGLLEMVQTKYIDVDLLPRCPKPWWFGYNAEIAESAAAFTDFLFAPSWSRRWLRARAALRAMFRSHRI